ncbi:hypothetical protein NDU88_006147 [Pleurodeles waltl]|uniref:Uncharacterized protein n=1 Tax=Pleurodeles waltl TaxID=8319 RepID=A0AAV7W9S2_PLEWA|nr:hypothetical protein NDU88_006147 [Pleurodeles waltl]
MRGCRRERRSNTAGQMRHTGRGGPSGTHSQETEAGETKRLGADRGTLKRKARKGEETRHDPGGTWSHRFETGSDSCCALVYQELPKKSNNGVNEWDAKVSFKPFLVNNTPCKHRPYAV